MPKGLPNDTAAGPPPRRLFVYTAGFWHQPRLRRILTLAGWHLRLGLPRAGDAVGVWGHSPHAWRGQAVAARRGLPLVRVEDAFLRSVLPGRSGGRLGRRGPVGLLIDPVGLHFDPSTPNLTEVLAQSPDAAARQGDAAAAIGRLRAADISKYNTHLPDIAPPKPGYVLVIDQTRGDASLRGAGRVVFETMLQAARDENPGARIVIRSHPETTAGLRGGHFTAQDLRPGDAFCDAPVSPWALVENADRVYAVSSQLGYEALLAGHRPRLFGQPCYAGWGLSDDETPIPRRQPVSANQLFAATHLLAPAWYDPCRDALTDFDGALNQIEAEARAWRQDRKGHLALGMRLWKRPAMARFFGQGAGVRFTDTARPDVTLVWANRADQAPASALRVEDGLIRSAGLGAALTPPLSLMADDLGIYYDPHRPSRLEAQIPTPLCPAQAARAGALRRALVMQGVSKYNLAKTAPDLAGVSARRVVLVPGQVEDDASIRLGADVVSTNAGLLKQARDENPDAFIIYKPHPDVEAGLRPGTLSPDQETLADLVARDADPLVLIARADTVWTMTSTLGFEALLRGVPVTVLGAPFYAGWGLTDDRGPVPERRLASGGASLDQLTHAALIACPRYHDPVADLPCPPETALWRLSQGNAPQPPVLRVLAKMQGWFAVASWLWR